jgi:hypothetical protein
MGGVQKSKITKLGCEKYFFAALSSILSTAAGDDLISSRSVP